MCQHHKQLIFYGFTFTILVCSPVASGSAVNCFSLVTAGIFALTILPIIIGANLNEYFYQFASSNTYTFGYGRLGVIFQLVCHLGAVTMSGGLSYLAFHRYSHGHHPTTFDPVFLISNAAILLVVSIVVSVSVGVTECRLRKRADAKLHRKAYRRCLSDGEEGGISQLTTPDSESSHSSQPSSTAEELNSVANSSVDHLSLHRRNFNPKHPRNFHSRRDFRPLCAVGPQASGSISNPQEYISEEDSSRFGGLGHLMLLSYVGSNVILLFLAVMMSTHDSWVNVDCVYPVVLSLLFLVVNAVEMWYILRILMLATPSDIDVDSLAAHLQHTYPFIIQVHNVRIWCLTPHYINFVAHLVVDPACDKTELLWRVQRHLKEIHQFENITLQLEDGEPTTVS